MMAFKEINFYIVAQGPNVTIQGNQVEDVVPWKSYDVLSTVLLSVSWSLNLSLDSVKGVGYGPHLSKRRMSKNLMSSDHYALVLWQSSFLI
jgi:hypothetical protein